MSGGQSRRSQPTPVSNLPAGKPPPAPDGELEQAIGVLRARVDEEFRIAERLDSKTRQAFALAAAFFAVIQTVAFGSFAEGGVTSSERTLLLIAAVVAGVAVSNVAHKAGRAEDLRDEADLSPSRIVDWANHAGSDPEYVRARLLSGLAEVANERTTNNESRATKYDVVADAARLALILSGVELVIAIVARL